MMSYLRYLWLLTNSGVQSILCCVFTLSSSCVPYVVNFSVLSIFDCLFGILYRLLVLCLVYPMLSVSLDCPFKMAASVFSNIF
jgi:hypothetical protein